MRGLKALLFQHVVVQSVIAFVSLVLWSDGKFTHGQVWQSSFRLRAQF